MKLTIIDRAKGPRRAAGEWNPWAGIDNLVCPWCGHDCSSTPYEWQSIGAHDYAVTTCPDCAKEFMCPDEKGELMCVGLISPADAKYLASRGELAHPEAGA